MRAARGRIDRPAFSRSPRVLILSAAVGAGHVRAAQALESTFAASVFPGQARHVDVLGYTNAAFRALYSRGYLELVNKAPDLLGWLYDWLDVPWKNNRLQLAFEKLNLGPFVRLLTDLRPDWALCTHFLPASIIAWLRRQRRFGLPQAVVVTDFDVHALWLLRDVEHYEIECELKTYQVEVELLEKTERYVHVLVAVDDGSLPASIVPSCRSFVRHKADSDYGRDSVVTEDRH